METRTTAEHERVAFGEFLRQARERRRLTLEQIAGETKIAPRILTSLEQGNVQPMPKGMYRRAMLRAYAESVGLDTDAALNEFERTFEEPPPRETPLPTLPLPAPTQQGGRMATSRRGVSARAIAGLGLAALVAVGGWWAIARDTERVASAPSQVTATPVTPALTTQPTPTQPAPPQPTPVTPAGATATTGNHQIAAAMPASNTKPETPRATEGRLVVVSEPPGARVTVNGIGWGATPLTISYLPLGDKRVRLTMSGYISEERTVRIDGQKPNATVRAVLRARP
jgi:cytoskeletal protein RodZ